jgi:hypothetical protein
MVVLGWFFWSLVADMWRKEKVGKHHYKNIAHVEIRTTPRA